MVTRRWAPEERSRFATAGAERRGEMGKGWVRWKVRGQRGSGMRARRATYHETGLNQTNGDGMVNEGVGERDEGDDGAGLALLLGAQRVGGAVDGTAELEVSDLAHCAVRFSVREACVVGVVLPVEVSGTSEGEPSLEGDVDEVWRCSLRFGG